MESMASKKRSTNDICFEGNTACVCYKSGSKINVIFLNRNMYFFLRKLIPNENFTLHSRYISVQFNNKC